MHTPEQPSEKFGRGSEVTVEGKTAVEHLSDRLEKQNKVFSWVVKSLRWLRSLGGTKME